MTRVFKTLLLWLIIGAMPLQALAAVMRASCAPEHGPALQAAAQGQALQAGTVLAHSGHHDTERHAVPDQDTGHKSLADGRHTSACGNVSVACCAGAVAPPPVAPSLTLHGGAEMIAHASAVLPAGYVPAIPERPPRSIFA